MIFSHVLDCFTKHSARKSYVPKPYKYDIVDPVLCQAKCQERPDCMYFQVTHSSDSSTNKCYLKNKWAKQRAYPNDCCTFGPKYCKGKNKYILNIRTHLVKVII